MTLHDLTLSHFTDADTLEPYSVIQDDERWAKPKGLWVSVDGEDDWPQWCASEEFGIGANRFVVTLAATANVLHLATVDELIEFSGEYARGRYDVDWPRLAEKYQGIVIAPYQWSLRLGSDVSWYYPWDVASGCIWDADAIEAVAKS